MNIGVHLAMDLLSKGDLIEQKLSLLPLALKSIMIHATGLTSFVNLRGCNDSGTFITQNHRFIE